MEKFVNPFSDYGFKLIFGTEISKELIIMFLNSLLNDEVITDIIFHNVEQLGLKEDARRAVFDIFCENDKGEFFIVEMQQGKQKYFSDRVLYYASFAILRQMESSKERLKRLNEQNPEEATERWKYNLKKVYVVCFLNYIMDSTHPTKYRWDVVRMDKELKEPFSDTLSEIYLEMPKFKLELFECDTFYKKILYVLKNIDIMARLPHELNDQIFQKLKSIVEVERMTFDERLAYEQSISAYRDLDACMDASFEDGMEKGMAKGEAEGIRLVARNLKQKGMDIALIMQTTGLSETEINTL